MLLGRIGRKTPAKPEYIAGEIGADIKEIEIPAPATGINHCATILKLKLKDGTDAIHLIKKSCSKPVVKFIVDTYGVIPYCWGHWTEFFPSLCRLEEEYKGRLQGLRMSYGMHVHDMQDERQRLARWEKLVSENFVRERSSSLDILPSGERIIVVDIISSLIENRNEVHVVNIQNKGAIENLPYDAVVEVSSLVGGYGIFPIYVGKLPEHLTAILNSHITCQKLTVEAALTGDRDIAYQAFLHDPQTAAKLQPEEARKLLNEMLKAHANYLPNFFKE